MRARRLLASLALSLSLLAAQEPVPLSDPPLLPIEDQEVFAPWWTLQPGWHTELEIRNNEKKRSIGVEPVVRLANGTEIKLPKVTVEPDQLISLDLHAALGAIAPDAVGKVDSYGSMVFRFNGATWASVYASLMIHMDSKPISFHFDAVPIGDPTGATSRESIWWLPTKDSKASLLLANSSKWPITARIELSDTNGTVKNFPVTVGALQSQQVELNPLIEGKLKGKVGGLRLILNRNANRLYASHVVVDSVTGYSATMRVFQRDPEEVTKTVSLYAPMLALSSPDTRLRFLDGTKLTSQIFLRNTLGTALKVRGWLNWRSETATGRYQMPEISLAANETRVIDVGKLQGPETVPLDAGWASVQLSFDGRKGDLVAIAASLNEEATFGLQTPFGYTVAPHWKGGRWQSSPRHQTIITIGNVGDRPARLVGTLFYSDGKGKYELPERVLQPHENAWFSLNDIINSQVPDRDGNTIPLDVTAGSYTFRDTSENLGKLFEGKVVIDKTWGHATHGCAICCPANPYLYPNPANLVVNQIIGMGAGISYCDGTYGPAYITGYASDNSSIASVNYVTGELHGNAPGSTTVRTQAEAVRTTCFGEQCCDSYWKTISASVGVYPTVVIAHITGIGKNNTRTVQVSLSPSPTSNVTLTLVTDPNTTGAAVFDSNNSTSLVVNQSTSVAIRGVTESSTRDNIKLRATFNGAVLAQEDFSVVWVALRLRNSTSDEVSIDNSGRTEYFSKYQTFDLGGRVFNGLSCLAGVEIVGTVQPANYLGTIVLKRQLVSGRLYDYQGTGLADFPNAQFPSDDTSDDVGRDDNPQSNSSAGKVYDLDAPGVTPEFIASPSSSLRLRLNFRQYAVLDSKTSTNFASSDLYWFSRNSCQVTQNGVELLNDLPSDNLACAGSTSIALNPGQLGACNVQ